MTTQNKNGLPTHGAAYDQVTNLNEQFLGAARKASSLYVDSYDKAVNRAIELELKVADGTQQDWLKGLIESQVEFMREFTGSYTSAARSLLK